ncbi:29777_t:CDS:2, partial [Racocetra persica]
IGDVLKDPNDIKRHRLKDEFDILMNYSVEIPCSTDCIFSDHEIIMCRSFLKEEQKIYIEDDDKINLGDAFERYNSGYPVMISGGTIEVSYHPDMTDVNNITTFSQMVVTQIMDNIDKIPKPVIKGDNEDEDL